jgi:hypothetical protein
MHAVRYHHVPSRWRKQATAGNTLFWSYIGQFIVLFSINKVEQEIDGSGSLISYYNYILLN